MAKIAKLVAVSFMTMVVRDTATEEEILSAAVPRLIDALLNDGLDNLEFIEDDTECPYSPLDDAFTLPRKASSSLSPPPRKCRLLGYQIESTDGKHGIPADLYSFEVLTEAAADRWLEMDRLSPTGSWMKVPVYAGDVVDPVIFNTVIREK